MLSHKRVLMVVYLLVAYIDETKIGGLDMSQENQEITVCIIQKVDIPSYSDVFASRERTAYRVGRPDGSLMKVFNIGESEAYTICTNLPEELLEIIKDHYGLIELDKANVKMTPEQLEAEDKELAKVTAPEVSSEVSDALTEAVDEGMDIESLTRDELRGLARQLEIKNYSKMTVDQLKSAIDEVVNAPEEV